MAVNDLLGVIPTTVAKFDGIPVEDFSKFVIFGVYLLVFIYLVEKLVLTFLLKGGCTRECCHAVDFFVCYVCWVRMLGCSCIHFRLRPCGMVGLLDQSMLCQKIIGIDVC